MTSSRLANLLFLVMALFVAAVTFSIPTFAQSGPVPECAPAKTYPGCDGTCVPRCGLGACACPSKLFDLSQLTVEVEPETFALADPDSVPLLREQFSNGGLEPVKVAGGPLPQCPDGCGWIDCILGRCQGGGK